MASGMASERVMWLMITVILFTHSYGCWEQEKLALLQLKYFLVQEERIESVQLGFPGDMFVPPLESWAAEKEDCCRWERVECDNTTGRVTSLQLHSVNNFLGVTDLGHYWNMSLFLPFQKLEILDLLGNQLAGFVQTEGLEKLRGLHNLRVLNLDNNYFNGSILSSLRAGFSSLRVLTLARNSLSSSTDITDLCSLRHLQELDLSGNFMRGSLPWCFSDLTSLEELVLSSNRLSGNIPSSPIRMMTSIKYLDLSKNFFRVPSSLGPFFNLSKLQYVDLGDNMIYQDMELLPSSAVPKFQLQVLRLSCCGDAGSFPEFLNHQRNLQEVYLSSISLKGNFPSWLLENNTNIQRLDLSNNSLSGPFQLFSRLNLSNSDIAILQKLPPYNASISKRLKLSFPSQVYSLDISSNSLDGHIPQNLGAMLPEIVGLNMSNNLLEGTIPTSFGYMKSLYSLDLSKNRLSGAIPENLTRDCYWLAVLRLSGNNLQGSTFPENFNLTRLEELNLDGNQFTDIGRSPMGQIDMLARLDVSNNNLSGRIPNWIGNMPQLKQLIMANNYIGGPIPLELCHLDGLKILDLSSNNLSGNLPSCLSPSGINHLHLSKNRLKGSLTDKFCNSTMLVTLDLSNNQFSGTIPRCINKFPQLSYLFLNNNGIQGRIPSRLCQLEKLSLLDLSHNNLYGLIPSCLKITTLIDVSGYYEDYHAPSPEANGPTGALPPSSFSIEGPIEFTTKSASRSYKGRIITFMSGIDLSGNNLSGDIPQELGSLNKALHALNLSHNSLTGHIPTTFSNLKEIESLDISFNRLSGTIPPQIVELHFLEVLNVSYNNLFGETPKQVAQFATFDDSSYKGNPLLCGKPLQRSCSGTVKPSIPAVEAGGDSDLSEMNIFFISFAVSYTIALLAIVTILWVNPYWRQAWFYYVDLVSSSCYYFVLDHLPKQICK